MQALPTPGAPHPGRGDLLFSSRNACHRMPGALGDTGGSRGGVICPEPSPVKLFEVVSREVFCLERGQASSTSRWPRKQSEGCHLTTAGSAMVVCQSCSRELSNGCLPELLSHSLSSPPTARQSLAV